MYENEKNEEYWMDLAEERGDTLGVDTREGSVYMDTQAGHCIRTSKFYGDLEFLHEAMMPDTAKGEFLSAYTELDSILRKPATKAIWSAEFVGVVPEVGTEFMCDGHYFTLRDVDGVLCLVANIAGEQTNHLLPDMELIPSDNVEGLESAKIKGIIGLGKAAESDDELRERWRESKINPMANNNVAHIKYLCERIEGIGRARILALWGGENTVKSVLISDVGQIVSEDKIREIQNKIDPIQKGYVVEVKGSQYTFGDGLGEAEGNIGLHFLAASAKAIKIDIKANIEMKQGYQLPQIVENVKHSVKAYFARLALESQDESQTTVRIATIGSIIAETKGVLDYDYETLRLNDGAENITIDLESVAVLSEVTFNAG